MSRRSPLFRKFINCSGLTSSIWMLSLTGMMAGNESADFLGFGAPFGSDGKTCSVFWMRNEFEKEATTTPYGISPKGFLIHGGDVIYSRGRPEWYGPKGVVSVTDEQILQTFFSSVVNVLKEHPDAQLQRLEGGSGFVPVIDSEILYQIDMEYPFHPKYLHWTLNKGKVYQTPAYTADKETPQMLTFDQGKYVPFSPFTPLSEYHMVEVRDPEEKLLASFPVPPLEEVAHEMKRRFDAVHKILRKGWNGYPPLAPNAKICPYGFLAASNRTALSYHPNEIGNLIAARRLAALGTFENMDYLCPQFYPRLLDKKYDHEMQRALIQRGLLLSSQVYEPARKANLPIIPGLRLYTGAGFLLASEWLNLFDLLSLANAPRSLSSKIETLGGSVDAVWIWEDASFEFYVRFFRDYARRRWSGRSMLDLRRSACLD